MPTPRAPQREEDEPLAMTWTVGRVAGVVVMVIMIGFWAWIFTGGPKQANPDRLDDRAFVDRTEQRCVGLLAGLKTLPNAADIHTAADRADVLDQATAKVAAMVKATEADAPRRGGDAKSLQGWFKDWHAYLGDRRDFARRLRKDPKAQFYVSESALKDTVDTTIETFSDVNDMPDCATPGDVG